MSLRYIAPDNVIIGERHRRDLGDIHKLAESMGSIGLLHPIVVTPDNRLIAGERRLMAAIQLEWKTIPVRALDIESIVLGEYAENELRKDFTPSERVAIGRAVEGALGERRGRPSEKVDNGPQFQGGHKTRDVAAKRAGFGSGKQYERAKRVVDGGTPELVEKMDCGDVSVSAAAEVARLPQEQQKEIAGLPNAEIVDKVRELREVRQFRESLPKPAEARRIAAEKGGVVLARDGRFHTATVPSADQMAARDRSLKVYGALADIEGIGANATEIVAHMPGHAMPVFREHVAAALNFITQISEALDEHDQGRARRAS